jgi:hypothetical protein
MRFLVVIEPFLAWLFASPPTHHLVALPSCSAPVLRELRMAILNGPSINDVHGNLDV